MKNLRLQTERIRRGWSRKYVGMRVGVTEEAVRLMENNRRKPSYEVMVKLEDLFNMTHRELFAAAPEENHDPLQP